MKTNVTLAVLGLLMIGCFGSNLPKSKEAQAKALAAIQFCRDSGGHPSTDASAIDKNFTVTCLYWEY